MKRVPAARLLCTLASACLLFLDGSILLAAASQNRESSPLAQSGKSTPTKADKSTPSQTKQDKRSSPVGAKQKATKKVQPKNRDRSGGLYHVVRKGENLFGISRAYHVSVESLIKANGLSRPSALRIGQRLFIPGVHQARKVEPFRPLTKKQRVEMAEVLEAQDEVEVEKEAESPGGVQARGLDLSGDPLRETQVESSAEEREGEQEASTEPSPEVASVPSSDAPSATIAKPDLEGFIWPLINRITSDFGPRGRRMHTGIDIAAPSYHEVVASADGEVIFVQHSGRGLGNAVVLQHDTGYRTLYGHGVVILVKEGDTVRRGEPIMGVGSTGHSTGNHLHFEIRKDGVPIDPLRLMPPTLDELIEDLRAEKKTEGPS